ncbi:uncharacterized protein LOC144366049 isoform X3 [Ictidomys tridecemlineatus]
MSVTAKLRKIRVSAVGKVTSINQLLHYGRNEPFGPSEGGRRGRPSHTPQVAALRGLLFHIARRKKNVPLIRGQLTCIRIASVILLDAQGEHVADLITGDPLERLNTWDHLIFHFQHPKLKLSFSKCT